MKKWSVVNTDGLLNDREIRFLKDWHLISVLQAQHFESQLVFSNSSVIGGMERFSLVHLDEYARVFVLGIRFRPCLIFNIKAGAYPRGAFFPPPIHTDGSWSFNVDIILNIPWKWQTL